MNRRTGSNAHDLREQNRMLVLRLITINHGISRVDLSQATGLAKMTVSNIVLELLQAGIIEESDNAEPTQSNSYGRRPIMLRLASSGPCICGMLIKRGLCQVVLANLDGTIFEQIDAKFERLDNADALIELLSRNYLELVGRTQRRVAALGISSLGPVDSTQGIILNPPYFYGIENVPIVKLMENVAGLPTFLVNDANAGALAEKLFGLGHELSNFMYLHIMNGIGAGFLLDGKLYEGDCGLSGEIGHTSINFAGPACVCGNHGCLDLYANIEEMRKLIVERLPLYPHSVLANASLPDWLEIVDAVNQHDSLAISVMDTFCSYITHSLVNVFNLLDLSRLIVGYDSGSAGEVIEGMLQRRLTKAILSSKYHEITVAHSTFGGDAPLIGAIATVADNIFTMRLPLAEMDMQADGL